MYIASIRFTIKKDKLVDFTASAAALTVATRRLAGCRHYHFYNEPEDSTRFLLYEEWGDKENFEKYKNSDLFKTSSKELFDYMEGPPSTKYFTATIDFQK